MRTGDLDVEAILTNSKLDKLSDVSMLNAFRIQINGSLTQFNMVDGISDEYEDEASINTGSSTNQLYDSTNDLYSPGAIDTDVKLLLHFDGTDGATSTTDDSPSAHSPITFFNQAQLDTAFQKFGTASLLLDGTGDELNIPDSSDFIPTTNWTLDLFVRHTDHAGIEFYIAHGNGVTNVNERWFLRHSDGQGIRFFWSGASFELTVQGGEITDSNFHHVALCKVGDDYGIYLDGVQTAFLNDSNTDNTAGILTIGEHDDAFFDGSLDEIRIIQSNAFSAAPVVGLTDTITVPTSAHSATSIDNMTLLSISFTAIAQADSARIVILETDVDAITINTDLTAEVSRDGGTTFSTVTLSKVADFDSVTNVYAGTVDISGQPSGTSMQYRIKSLNTKDLKLKATGLSWD